MNYRLSRNGQEIGVFSLEEIQQRRASGEFTGAEFVWAEGMTEWKPLNSVIPPIPTLQKSAAGRKSNTGTIVGVIVAVCVLASLVMGFVFYRVAVSPAMKQLKQELNAASPGTQASAMELASRPISFSTNSLTETDALKVSRDFRIRQYVDGYRLRGERNPACDALALGLISNWIAKNYGGVMDSNLPALGDLSNRLATNPACTDPVALTVAAINTSGRQESRRRLERAVQGFESSKHLAYPKMYAVEELAAKLADTDAGRLPALDAQALQYLDAALDDGSIGSEDQPELAEILMNGWGQRIFYANAVPVYSKIQSKGDKFRWLGLVLEGEEEIALAWQARGSGYIGSVTKTGWQGFYQHLGSARSCLTEAWNLQPNWPLAPCKMMKVSLGDAGLDQMRLWFDRTVAAQIDYPEAWSEMRWGLRPRWYGDTDAMLAFGISAINTHRFDTDVPRKFMDSLYDVEAETGVPAGQHTFGNDNIWPHLREMYEGYITLPSQTDWYRDGWRGTYAVVAFIAGKYDVAREQLQPLNWQPRHWNLTGWARDLTLMPLEVAARTGPQASAIEQAESFRDANNIGLALKAYDDLSAATNLDERTRAFVCERQHSLGAEQGLQHGAWVRFLPADARFIGWQTNTAGFKVLPDGSLEAQPSAVGHMLYSRIRVGTEFEVRGQIIATNSFGNAFEAGVVMGVPDYETDDWFSFFLKRNTEKQDIAALSHKWIMGRISKPLENLNSGTNSFDLRFQGGQFSATVNGQDIFQNATPPQRQSVTTNEFYVGLASPVDSAATIRYRNLEIRSLKAR